MKGCGPGVSAPKARLPPCASNVRPTIFARKSLPELLWMAPPVSCDGEAAAMVQRDEHLSFEQRGREGSATRNALRATANLTARITSPD